MLLLAQVMMQPLLLTQAVTPRRRRTVPGLRLLQRMMQRRLLTQGMMILPRLPQRMTMMTRLPQGSHKPPAWCRCGGWADGLPILRQRARRSCARSRRAASLPSCARPKRRLLRQERCH